MSNTKSAIASKEATSDMVSITTHGKTPQSTKKKVQLPYTLKYFFTYLCGRLGLRLGETPTLSGEQRLPLHGGVHHRTGRLCEGS